ncbi:hypothetical protein AB0F88_38610 [Streptosporangium sp. NPDC023963]|uniref:hypothetical protein n=1 Tax=Streptosporangium sp. NPDC023963 TaxID=3155608 RepID=UPI003432B547
MSGPVIPVNLFDRILAMVGQADVPQHEIDAEIIRINTTTQDFDQPCIEHLYEYHLLGIQLERLRNEEVAARRAVGKARGTDLMRLRERKLREVHDEMEHLTYLRARMEEVLTYVNETTAVIRRGRKQLRQLRATIAVEGKAALAAEERAAAYARLQRSREELHAIRDEVDRRAAWAYGAEKQATDDMFLTELILEEAHDRHLENRPSLGSRRRSTHL